MATATRHVGAAATRHGGGAHVGSSRSRSRAHEKKKLSSNKPAAVAPVYESSTCPPTSYFPLGMYLEHVLPAGRRK